jgi:hypothetical protein
MTTRSRCAIAIAALAVVAIVFGGSRPAAQRACRDCYIARVWEVPPGEWTAAPGDAWKTPEMATDKLRSTDVGVAFSGGGTRSATATLGELRGLQRNGWLDKVKYMSAVSGGAWAAIPYTYSTSPEPIAAFLGTYQEPGALTRAALATVPPRSLTESIVNSGLFASGLREALHIGREKLLSDQVNQLVDRAKSLLTGASPSDPARFDKTYANVIGKVFVAPHVTNGMTSFFAWDDPTIDDIKAHNPALGSSQFVTVAKDRPFLIVGGTMIYGRPVYDFPRLIPVEFTPLYSGARQQYSGRLGGTYVWPWAYDSVAARDESASFVNVTLDPAARKFTLSDLAATTGAAPELATIINKPLNPAAEFFPSFNHFTVRNHHVVESRTADKKIESTIRLPHGDGGGSDNLAVMPLLARHVKNILVFINSNVDYDVNDDLEALFGELDKADAGGDRQMTSVFDRKSYQTVKDDFRTSRANHDALVSCHERWHVNANEFFNIRAYDGLNICFLYNATAVNWEELLPKETLLLLHPADKKDKDAKRFHDFPWYKTFGENTPHLIKLDADQVNMLSSLTSWIVVNQTSVDAIRRVMGNTLPAPPRP